MHLLEHRYGAGLPVVRVDDGWALAAEPRVFQRRPGEHRKPPGVVGIVLARAVRVETLAIEQRGHVDEHGRDAAPGGARMEGHVLDAITELDGRHLHLRARNVDAS